jgi:hypothetical protein
LSPEDNPVAVSFRTLYKKNRYTKGIATRTGVANRDEIESGRADTSSHRRDRVSIKSFATDDGIVDFFHPPTDTSSIAEPPPLRR